jgi:hypothetical protein
MIKVRFIDQVTFSKVPVLHENEITSFVNKKVIWIYYQNRIISVISVQ